jgi:DNA-binding GntR family transcriptional regulator
MTWTSTSVPYLKPPAAGEPDTWTHENKGRGGQRVLSTGEQHASPEVAESLGLEPGATVVHRSRLILLDEVPIEIVSSYWPADIAAGTALAELKPIQGGAVRLLADLGWTAATSIEDVSAELADEAWSPTVEPGTPLLVIRRTLRTHAEVPFEHTVMASWDGHRQRYLLNVA